MEMDSNSFETLRWTRVTSFRRSAASIGKTNSAALWVDLSQTKVFFFGDYQRTGTNQGIDTGLIPVLTLVNRTGDLSDQAGSLTGTVAGPYLASLLQQKLGHAVSANEALLPDRLHLEQSVRFSKCNHSSARMVGTRHTPAASRLRMSATPTSQQAPRARKYATTKGASAPMRIRIAGDSFPLTTISMITT
jgi:hypothetical protein